MASAWPSDDLTTAALDANTDTLAAARIELYNAVQKLKTVLDTRNANSGVCGLDANGYVSVSQLRVGLCGSVSDPSGGATAGTITWATEDFDDGSFFDLGAQNTRLTIPANVSRVRITANIGWRGDPGQNSIQYYLSLKKNGVTMDDFYSSTYTTNDIYYTHRISSMITGIFSVSSADYFEVYQWSEQAAASPLAIPDIEKGAFQVEVLAS